MGQTERILKYLQEGNSITPLEALKRFGSMRLGARIYELKQQNYHITTKIISSNGKHYAKYTLEKDKNRE